jgi:acetolactate synthase II small subunit
MSRTFEIELDHSEGALMRVLGTVERRGFGLVALNADKPDADSYALRLRIDGARDPDVLCRQLERLVEVRTVRLLPDPVVALQSSGDEAPPPGFQATWLSS